MRRGRGRGRWKRHGCSCREVEHFGISGRAESVTSRHDNHHDEQKKNSERSQNPASNRFYTIHTHTMTLHAATRYSLAFGIRYRESVKEEYCRASWLEQISVCHATSLVPG